ncbi:16423_t:CDS:2, partial [Gigaspora rosea]
AVDHRHEWIANYEKSSEWLTKQFIGDTSLEKEIYECARIFVVSRYEVEKYAINADNSFVAAIRTKDDAIEEEKNELKRQKKACIAKQSHYLGTVVNQLRSILGSWKKTSLEAALRSHFISDNLSKLDNDTLLTAVATWYLRLLAVDHVDHIPHWATVCDASYKWFSSQIKNPQIERELLGSAKKFGIRGYNVDDDTLEEDEGNLELYLRDLKKHDKIMMQSNIIEYFF